MRTDLVFTLTGKDRVGLVDEVTGVLLHVGANVEMSHMARLGGVFAMLVLLSLPDESVVSAEASLRHLIDEGYRISFTETSPDAAAAIEQWKPYRVSVHGADHEGIVHEIARGLSQQGITIEWAETSVTEAPVSGAPLFDMTTLVRVPPAVDSGDWIDAVIEAGRHVNVDVEVEPS
jgi:glycine cleavage system transcriptional repressor